MNRRHPTLGIGIIGYGGFGRFLHRSWSDLPTAEVRAVADDKAPAPDGAQTTDLKRHSDSGRFTPETGTEAASEPLRFYSDWQEMLDDPSVELVSIATPPATHAEMACTAMRAGKHVLIEKPIATIREDAERIRDVQRETGCVAAVDYMLRFNPIVETLQYWARHTPFGPLRRVLVENYAQDSQLPPEHWFWDRKLSGGILVEHAVHFIDVVHGCTSARTVTIDGLSQRRADERVDRMGLTVVYEDGLVMQQYHAFTRPGFFEDTTMRFVFDLAQVEVSGWIPLSGNITALTSDSAERFLRQLPGLTMEHRISIEEAADTSRPEGWGLPDGRDDGVRSSGVRYEAGHLVRGTFALVDTKTDAYASALRSILADVTAAIRNPGHQLRAGVPEGLRSLEVALQATESAFQGGNKALRE